MRLTIKEIAKQCNVSPSTVSNILNGRTNVGEETRQRVLRYVEESGYQPNYFAQNIRKQSTRMLSIITEDLTTFGTNPIVEAIMAHCDDNNYRTVLMNLRLYKKWQDRPWYEEGEQLAEAVKPIIQETVSIKVDGIIYVAGHCRVIDCFPRNFPIPTVVAYGMSKGERYPSIVIDDEKGGYDIARYLTSRGHSKIGIIAGAMDNYHTKYRLMGYQKALFEEGVLYNPSWVYYGDWKRTTGYQGAKQLVDEGITALFCMNDEMAAGAYDYLYERGMVIGRDISIIGYDNMELSEYLRPRLTTNEIPLGEIGRKSAEILLQTLEGTAPAYSDSMFKVPCRIIQRESVATLG